MLTKYLVKREARKILQGIEKLDTSNVIIDDLFRWRRAAISLIKEVYGEESDLLNEVQSIRIEYPVELDDNGLPIPYSDLNELQQSPQKELRRVVKSFMSTVESTGLPFGYRAPRRNVIIYLVATALLSALITFGGVYATFKLNQSAQSETTFGQGRNEQWKVTEVEFYHWYRNLRWQYQHGLDSISDITIQTMGYRAAQRVIRDKWLEYAEKFERQTDKTLDSFLMEYSIQGGDTLTLHYKRKPLGNLSQELRNSPAYKR